ncbi:isochorismatase family protein [Peptococcaceae bacterium CEB3]|nr:isochorismatase family protein [Peptococcaceae bacterium CEB3]
MDKYTLHYEDAVLMVVDIQERLLPAMTYGERVIEKTNILIKIAGRMKMPIVFTEEYPKGLGKTADAVVGNLAGATYVEKLTFSAYTPELIAYLGSQGRREVIVTGMETHVCVFQTVRDLLGQGYRVFAVADALCSRTKENYRNGLALMRDMGAVVTNTESVFFDLMKIAGTPGFKELSKLIK